MKLTAILSSIVVILATAPAYAETGGAATILALDTCRQMARGVPHRKAFLTSLQSNWPLVKNWVMNTDSSDVAIFVFREEMAICPEDASK